MPGHQHKTTKMGASATTILAEVDEITPLLPGNAAEDQTFRNGYRDPESPEIEACSTNNAAQDKPVKSLMGTISVLLIGVFISQADTSLVMATYGKISSEFHELESGSWLLSSYMLAMCVSQPFFGKLSDIYGRKRCLQTAYILFGIGTAGSGLGLTMSQVIIARAIQGAGGAGMVCMVSILLTDLVPIHEVAAYRSYVNIVQTVGRSCGGAFGGLLASTIGWRWAFLIQCPPTLLSIILVEWKLKLPQKNLEETKSETNWDKLRRIDFVGAFFMSLTILAALLVLDTGGQKYAWTHPVILSSFCLTIVSGISFALIERYWAREPIFPLQLLTRYVVVTSYISLLLQNFAQSALFFVIPMYFQVTVNASPGVAGAHLVPSIAGNTVAGLLTGVWVKRTGRYKVLVVLAGISTALAYTLLLTLWWGHTTPLESFVIFPAGFGTGLVQSCVFIGLTASVADKEVAIAGSGLYLSGNIGAVAGISGASAIYQIGLKAGLETALIGREDSVRIISQAVSDINYVQNVGSSLRQTMLPAYISAFHYVFSPLSCASHY
ncbi:putative major facilitator superfamily transporter [Corynespora cassiicola Philippines]|uniref:Putative major facilitator superfamily transporter n=1 Tax=Corynespora cassiicola Philippines TaxID=1448308 RepID=A0A2T2P1D0_CORCC|nr:putative major facilitator superfamily transporter [Corynespora cassiicola Philippines]